MRSERDWLYAFIATQAGSVTHHDLLLASQRQLAGDARDLAAILSSSGTVSSASSRQIESLLQSVLALHGGDPSAALSHAAFALSKLLPVGPESVTPDAPPLPTADAPVTTPQQPPMRGRAGESPTLPMPVSDAPFGGTHEYVLSEQKGRYVNLRSFAHGGMGHIYLAHDVTIGRDVAFKVMQTSEQRRAARGTSTPHAISASTTNRFLQEARTAGRLEHPGIVPVYDVGLRADGTPYYTMKLVRGRTLRRAMLAANTLEQRLALLPHFVDLCQTIAYAHDRGVIHRDIKPDNVLIGEFGETIVIDWGLAKVRGQHDLSGTRARETSSAAEEAALPWHATREGEAIGTPEYMSPEQAQGRLEAIDERSDVYCLGAVLYTLLSGRPPFHGSDLAELLKNIMESQPPPLPPGVPRELADIAMHALHKNPENRYPSAKALAEEIERFQSGAIVQAHEYTTYELLARLLRRHWKLLGATAAGALLIAGITAYSYASILAARDREREQRQNAELQRKEAQEERERAENLLYRSSVALAFQNLERGQNDMARESLLRAPIRFRHWEWGYARYCTDSSALTINCGDLAVNAAVLSPDSAQIAMACSDGVARVYERATGRLSLMLKGHAGNVGFVAFSPNGTRIATASSDNTACIWDAATGSQLLVLRGHSGTVTHVCFSHDGHLLLSAAMDGTLRLWSSEDGTLVSLMSGFQSEVDYANFSPDGRHIVVDVESGIPAVLDAKNGNEVFRLIERNHFARYAAYSPDGTLIVTAGNDQTATLWDAASGGRLREFRVHAASLRWAVFSADGKKVITTLSDNSVRIWDVASGAELLVLRGHNRLVNTAVISSDNRWVVSASEDGTTKIWGLNAQPCVLLADYDASAGSVAFFRDGSRMVTALHDGTGMVQSLPPHEPVVPLRGHAAALNDARFSPDGRLVITASSDHTARIWDAGSGAAVRVLEAHSDEVRSAAFSPDGRHIGTASWDKTAILWDADTYAKRLTLRGHRSGINCVDFSPDSRCLATASGDATVQVWDTSSGELIHTLTGHNRDVISVKYSGDGKYLLSTSRDATARIWIASTGALLHTLKGQRDWVTAGAFSPDGLRVVTCSAKQLSVWEMSSGTLLVTLDYRDALNALVFSGDGATVAAAADSGAIVLWEASPWVLDGLPRVDGPFDRQEQESVERFELWKRLKLTAPV